MFCTFHRSLSETVLLLHWSHQNRCFLKQKVLLSLSHLLFHTPGTILKVYTIKGIQSELNPYRLMNCQNQGSTVLNVYTENKLHYEKSQTLFSNKILSLTCYQESGSVYMYSGLVRFVLNEQWSTQTTAFNKANLKSWQVITIELLGKGIKRVFSSFSSLFRNTSWQFYRNNSTFSAKAHIWTFHNSSAVILGCKGVCYSIT